jgi:bacterioferritin-associated ferredoxin
MIICSCNTLSSNSIQQIIEEHSFKSVPSVQEIMEKHGCSIQCATCAFSIKLEIRKHYESLHRSV